DPIQAGGAGDRRVRFVLMQTHEGANQNRLPATGLADDAKSSGGIELQADIVEDPGVTGIAVEGRREVLDRQDRAHDASPVRSMRLRRCPATVSRENTVRNMKAAGTRTMWG